MATIGQDIAQIRQAVYGEEVREAIADGIENCYKRIQQIPYSTSDPTAAGSALEALIPAISNRDIDSLFT